MDRSDVINLIKLKPEQNDFGLFKDMDAGATAGHAIAGKAIVGTWTIKSREVFCDVRSITQTEWFNAGRNGIEHPAFLFVMNRNEYEDEQIVEYNGKRYGVYRTYAGRNETLELYCEAKGGLHSGGEV